MERLTPLFTWLQTRNGTLAELGFGAMLLVFGWLLIPGGSAVPSDATDSPSNGSASVDSGSEPVREDARYRLNWSMEDGVWRITPMGGGDTVEVAVIPGPRGQWRQPGFVPLDQVRRTLLDQLRDWKMTPNSAERSALLAVKVEDEPLFTAVMLRTGSPGADGPGADASVADSTRSSVTLSAGQPPLPEGFYPLSPAFAADMKAWQGKVLNLLQGAAQENGTVEILFESQAGVMVRAPMTADARRTAMSQRFGEDYRHAALYLQIVARRKGADLTVDGQVGPGTRRALAALLTRENWQGDMDRFTQMIRSYVGRNLPTDLVPGEQAFQNNLNAWRNRLLPALPADGGSVTVNWTPDFASEAVTIELTAAAVDRIRTAGFGQQRQDEVIYLQFLANTFGESLLVDGDYGPNTEKALGRMMRNAFRRPTSERAYQRILAGRY